MSTDELITELRVWAEGLKTENPSAYGYNILEEAADRLEELKPVETPCSYCQEFTCEGCKYCEERWGKDDHG